MLNRFILCITTLLLVSCVGGVSEQLRLSETEIYFGAEGGTATVTSNIKCALENIKDNQGSVYTWEYYQTPSGRHKTTQELEANGLTAKETSYTQISIFVSPSTEQREWTIKVFAGDSGSREFKVYQNAGGH
ncbi:MAG: hypothetical protein KBS36_02275 [Bacteroidales bacterium]|nr:hypothetical protein [Candidatus Cryptobacteroides fimicaballi]